MDYSADMEKKGIKRLMFQFSLPTFIMLTLTSIFGIFDKIIIGRGVGEQGLSVFSASMPMIMISLAFGAMVSSGASTMISTRLGRGKKERAEQVICNSILIVTIVSLLISIISVIFLSQILQVLMPGNVLREQAKVFLIIMLLGSVFRNISMCLSDFIRAEGNPKYSMVIAMIEVSLNFLISLILICGCGFGIEASAAAIIISNIISFTMGIKYFMSKNSILHIRIKDFRIKPRIINNTLKIGFPVFTSRFLGSITTIMLNRQLSLYAGNRGIAAVTIIMSIFFLMSMPIMSISQGMEPIIGYNYGAKQFKRVKKTLILGMLVSTAMAVSLYIVSCVNAKYLIALFNNSSNGLNTVAHQGLKIVLLSMPIMGIQIIAGGYFQCTGKYKQSLIITLYKTAGFMIPILILPMYFGLNGIWATFVVQDVLYFILVCSWLYFDIRDKNRKIT